MEPPTAAREHMSTSWQLEGQAVYTGILDPVNDLADLSVLVHPVKRAILTAGILRPNLLVRSQAPEVPVHIIGWADI
jgi:hypothetical protein